MKERKDSFNDIVVKVKDSFTLRQLAAAFVILFGVAASIASDYLTAGFDASIYRDPAYWINLAMSQGAIIVIMFCMYSIVSEREENNNEAVKNLRDEIFKAHCSMSKYSLSERFEDYVYVQNIQRKRAAYTKKMERRILKAKSDDKRKQLRQQLSEGLASIESVKVKYNKIRISTIFSRTSLVKADDENLDDGQSKTTRRMLLSRVVSVIAFGVLLSSITFDAGGFGPSLLVKTFVKLFQAAYAMFIGGKEGVDFVRGPLLTALDNRASFIQKFLDKNMPSQIERKQFDDKQASEEQKATEEILQKKREREDGIVSDNSKENTLHPV